MEALDEIKKLVERIGINIRSNLNISPEDKEHLQELIDLIMERINKAAEKKENEEHN